MKSHWFKFWESSLLYVCKANLFLIFLDDVLNLTCSTTWGISHKLPSNEQNLNENICVASVTHEYSISAHPLVLKIPLLSAGNKFLDKPKILFSVFIRKAGIYFSSENNIAMCIPDIWNDHDFHCKECLCEFSTKHLRFRFSQTFLNFPWNIVGKILQILFWDISKTISVKSSFQKIYPDFPIIYQNLSFLNLDKNTFWRIFFTEL